MNWVFCRPARRRYINEKQTGSFTERIIAVVIPNDERRIRECP